MYNDEVGRARGYFASLMAVIGCHLSEWINRTPLLQLHDSRKASTLALFSASHPGLAPNASPAAETAGSLVAFSSLASHGRKVFRRPSYRLDLDAPNRSLLYNVR